jgi:hypothetical protein
MTTFFAVVLGIAGAVYAIWPSLRGARTLPLAEELSPEQLDDLEAATGALRGWSVAAGELPGEAALDPEEVPK